MNFHDFQMSEMTWRTESVEDLDSWFDQYTKRR